MIITMNRPVGAPFSLYAPANKQALISEEDVKNLDILTWESMEVKNYCLAVNQQKEFNLKGIDGLKDIQIASRKTAALWLNSITIKLNALYNEVHAFCITYTGTYDELSKVTQDLSKEHQKTKFKRILSIVIEKLSSIQTKSQSLTNELKNFRGLLERDNRAFQGILEQAEKLKVTNKSKMNSLQNAIEELGIEIQALNSKIARAATLGTIGALAFIVGAVLFLGGIVTAFLPVLGAFIGFAMGAAVMGAEYANLAAYIKKRNEKNKELQEKNEALSQLQNELAALTAIEQQYKPLVESGRHAIEVVQNLFEGWGLIVTNFQNLHDQIDKVEHPDDTKNIQLYLKETLATSERILEIVQKHEKAGLIENQIEAPIVRLFAPSYEAAQPLTLPMPMYSAYVNRMYGFSLLT